MRHQNYVVAYNRFILDRQLYPSTKRVFTAMLKYSSRHGTVRKTVEELAALSGCSPSTVQQAIEQLQEYGYIRRIRCYRYSVFYTRPVFDSNTYYIRKKKLGDSYTLIPVELLTADISHAMFVVALYIYKTAGRVGRSWASLRAIARWADLSKATVCRALKVLKQLQLLASLLCIKANKAHSCNSYYPTSWVRPGGVKCQKASGRKKVFAAGGLIFNKHQVINKITRSSIEREREKGVGEFGDLYNFWAKNLFDDLFFFDGTGVKVSACGEPNLTG